MGSSVETNRNDRRKEVERTTGCNVAQDTWYKIVRTECI